MVRDTRDAIVWARSQITSRSQDWTGWCQKFVRSSFGVGGGFASAIAQWEGARYPHWTTDPNSAPRGAPVFWAGGKFGHVALSLGDGRCISTDAKRRGWPDIVTIDSISRNWGYEFLGWTEDMNGVRVYTPPKKTLNITAVFNAKTRDERVIALGRVVQHGNRKSKAAAQQWLDAIDQRRNLKKIIRGARSVLKSQEQK